MAIIFSLAFSFNRLNFPKKPPNGKLIDSPFARANSSSSRCFNVKISFANCCEIVEAPPAFPKLENERAIALKSTPECSINRSSSVEIRASNTKGLINSLNKRTVKSGEGILVPAGIPHAIAEGIFILELQEPTDFSILLEWEGFAVDGLKDGHLNLGFDLALQALDLNALKKEDVEKLVVSTENDSSLMRSMLPVQAEPYFRSHLIRPKNAAIEFAPGFAIILVTKGSGVIHTEKQGNFDTTSGDAFIIPFESSEIEN